MRLIVYLLSVISVMFLMGCSASGHKYYDAFRYSPPTTSCKVIWVHSYEAAKYRLDNELPRVELLGKSSFVTGRNYDKRAAASDCKKAGGDYIIVISEGYQGSSSNQITVRSTQTYHTSSNTSYSGGFSYGKNWGNYYGNSVTYGTYQMPTYDTFNYTVNYYGYSYYVYKGKEDLYRYY